MPVPEKKEVKENEPAVFAALTLDDISLKLSKILTELEDEADEGKKEFYSGTATTTISVIDLLKSPPYHAVKGYILNNDGVNNLYFSQNTVDRLDMDFIESSESIPISYNRKTIVKMFIKTLSGSSGYRLWFLW